MAPAKVGEFYLDKVRLIAEVVEVTDKEITLKLVLPFKWADDPNWAFQTFSLKEWQDMELIKVNNLSAARALYGFKV